MKTSRLSLLAGLVACAFPASAVAYIGPGAGIGVIGSFLALLGALVLAAGIVLIWPIRRLLRRIRGAPGTKPSPGEARLAGKVKG
jgi:hypothetical protein